MQRAGIKDILAGLIFLGFGAAFGYAATGYPIGTAFRMGPGYFPLLLAGALALLGAAIVVKGFAAAAAEGEIGPVPWRALVLLLGGAHLLRRDDPRPWPRRHPPRHRLRERPRQPAEQPRRRRRDRGRADSSSAC